MNNDNKKFPPQVSKQTINWVLSVLLMLSALGALGNKSPLASFMLALAASLLLPPLEQFWKQRFSFLNSRVIRNVIIVILFFGGVFSTKNIEKKSTKSNYLLSETTSEQYGEDGILKKDEGRSVIKHDIIHATTIRFDKAVSYFVLIDEINLSDAKFKEHIRQLISEIVSKNGAKISIDILDNKEVLELYYKSHYGTNTLGRILNKRELEKLEKHLVSSFSGELETDIYFNTLYFFPSATKNSEKVGQFVETIEFNP